MSLLDSLLLEGYRDPHEVYISLRADGQRGSGTIDDPYDGGTRLGPLMSGTVSRVTPLTLLVLAPQQQALFAAGPWAGINTASIVGATGDGADYFNHVISGTPQPWDPIVPETNPQVLHAGSLFKVTPSGEAEPPAAPNSTDLIYAIRPALQGEALPSRTFPANITREALVTGSVPHGLVNYDIVILTHTADPNSVFNGTFVVTATPSANSFAIRVPPIPWPATDPSVHWQKVIHLFDEVMAALPLYSTAHLGPGTFETRGGGYFVDLGVGVQVYVGYNLKAGHRVLGSGIGATTVKLVFPVNAANQTSAFANFYTVPADFAEITDLTVDCNAAFHAVPPGMYAAPVTCGAMELNGSFIRVRRVRVINFCVQARAECFAIFVHGGVFNVVEDCIVEQPGENNTHETTLLICAGDYYGSAISPIVRQNYINCSYVQAGASSEYVAISNIIYNGDGTATFTTKRPHNRTGPDQGKTTNNVLISGVFEQVGSNLINTVFNASFAVLEKVSDTQFKILRPADAPAQSDLSYAGSAFIGVDFHGSFALGCTAGVTEGNALYDCGQGVYEDTGSTRDAVVRDNYFSNVTRGVIFDFNPAGGGVEIPDRPARTGVNLVSLTHSGSDGKTANANSGTPPASGAPHGLVEGENVQISGALMPDESAPPAGTYNGNYTVHVVDSYNFTYLMTNNPGQDAKLPTSTNPIRVGIFSLTRDPTNHKIGILESPLPHFFKVGDVVGISGAVVGSNDVDPPQGTYNATYAVKAVISSTRFAYEMISDPGMEANASTTAHPILFRSRWQTHHLVCERNIFDLYAMDGNSAFPLGGFGTIALQSGDLFMFPQAVVRENLFGHIDGSRGALLDSGYSGYFSGSRAFRIQSFGNALIERNIINVSDPHPLHYLQSSHVTGFGNQTPTGQALSIEEDVQGGGLFGPFEKRDTLDSKVQDALIMSLL